MCFILICVGMFHIFLNIFDIFIYMFDMLIDISICLLIYISLYIYIRAKGCDMEFSRSSKLFSRFFHHKFEIL